ncbi:PilZ domain-containing protein [Hyalangium sp.]|uniref:PilZ domain-containing protein n=1 Tax=Hyalangium sp. TaxID=2028555 RepID=UPI002D514EA6|nr:PilZ domain-containing protein [Hyalangium sp.]HYH98437.1 PilZ domain-containing protein [Hyalangium sp.]
MQRKGARKVSGPAGSTRTPEELRDAAPRTVHVPKLSAPQPDERRSGSRPEEPRRPGGRSAQPVSAPVIERQSGNEPEHRHFPRALLATRFELWREEGGRRSFSATLMSQNVSVSGAFLESTFFMPMGTQLQVRFSLDEGAEAVQARAEIIREERSGTGGRSGFGIRFVEFSGQTEVSLARLFLGMRLRDFAEEYLQSRRARSLPNELERVVDVLAAWELLKASSPSDPWQGA